MAEQKYQQKKIEMESSADVSKELKRKKRMKLLVYALVFAIFQTTVILVFSLTVMRIKNPKFRLQSVVIEDMTPVAPNQPPSFNIKLITQVAVKNTNFGLFKFNNTTILSFEVERESAVDGIDQEEEICRNELHHDSKLGHPSCPRHQLPVKLSFAI